MHDPCLHAGLDGDSGEHPGGAGDQRGDLPGLDGVHHGGREPGGCGNQDGGWHGYTAQVMVAISPPDQVIANVPATVVYPVPPNQMPISFAFGESEST